MDNIWLTGPLGTQWNIGSWLDKTQQLDYGAGGVMRQQLTQTTFVEGAQLGYETAAGPRKMTFPIRVPSGGVAGLSVDLIEASLRQMVRPGGHVDLQPQGIATAEMVRFDILGGDVAHNAYSVDLQRINRRPLMLTLQTQPFGYWPTWITIASVAGVEPKPLVRLNIPAASVIGDVPAPVRLMIRNQPLSGASPVAESDFIAWGIGGTASWSPTFMGQGSVAGAATSQSWFLIGNGATARYDQSASYVFGATPIVGRLTGAFTTFDQQQAWFKGFYWGQIRGTFRAYGYFKMTGGNAQSLRAVCDVIGHDTSQPVATGNPIATISPVASLNGASFYSLIDLGEIRAPIPAASSYPQIGAGAEGGIIRVSVAGASDGSTATTTLDFAGISLLPISGGGGVMPRGLLTPSPMLVSNFFDFGLDTSARLAGRFNRATSGLDIAGLAPDRDALEYYRGGFPYIGGTDQLLTIVQGERLYNQTILTDGGPVVQRNQGRLNYSVQYQPRFTFTHGL